MTVDPFHGGPTETHRCKLMPEEQHVAALAVMRRFTGGPAMWDMLDVLGLTDTAEALLSARRQPSVHLRLVPEPPPTPAEPPALRSAPVLRRPDLPLHRQGPPTWANEKRTADAIARARALLAAEPTVEAAPVSRSGVPIPRCARRIHHKIGDNVHVHANGRRTCVACEQLRNARDLLRGHGVAW
jgi:hypothetical protein